MNPKTQKARRSKRTKKVQNGALLILISCFVLSALIRLGLSGPAIAEQLNSVRQDFEADLPLAVEDTNIDEMDLLLEAIRDRQEILDHKEDRIAERMVLLERAQNVFERKRRELAEAEQRLAATLAQTDGAVLRDLEQLTAMYENMKPKNAAEIFNEMAPDFSAGFLIRMNPQAAADILSGMGTDVAYQVSLVMASRNITANSN